MKDAVANEFPITIDCNCNTNAIKYLPLVALYGEEVLMEELEMEYNDDDYEWTQLVMEKEFLGG